MDSQRPCAPLRGEQGVGRPPAGDKPELLDISLPKRGDHVGMSSSPFQETSRRLQWRGMFLVLAASLLWGTTGTAQSLVPGGLSSLWIGAGRLAVAALFFVGMHAMTQRKGVEGPLVTGMGWALACGCVGGWLHGGLQPRLLCRRQGLQRGHWYCSGHRKWSGLGRAASVAGHGPRAHKLVVAGYRARGRGRHIDGAIHQQPGGLQPGGGHPLPSGRLELCGLYAGQQEAGFPCGAVAGQCLGLRAGHDHGPASCSCLGATRAGSRHRIFGCWFTWVW
jgi:hypothetical protein